MAKDVATFVAEDLWLFIALVTFVLAGLFGMAGLGTLSGPVAFLGWFFLTPIFLFWGEEIAAHLYGYESEAVEGDSEGAPEARPEPVEDDPLEQLKSRYATGELTDSEFEQQLERLIEVDERYERRDAYGAGSLGSSSAGGDEATGRRTDDSESSSPDREYERERT